MKNIKQILTIGFLFFLLGGNYIYAQNYERPDSTVVIKYDNGDVKFQRKYLKGKLISEREYYPNGKIRRGTKFRFNGHKLSESICDETGKEISSDYYRNGNLKEQHFTTEDGSTIVINKYYYRNGKLRRLENSTGIGCYNRKGKLKPRKTGVYDENVEYKE